MKIIARTVILTFALASGAAYGCQLLPTDAERARDEFNLARERELATVTAKRSDLVFIGTVRTFGITDIAADTPDRVTLLITERLKGSASSPLISLPHTLEFIFSCDSADMFHNAMFRIDAEYIVYVADGEVLRAAPIDRSAWNPAFTFDEERLIVVSADGT